MQDILGALVLNDYVSYDVTAIREHELDPEIEEEDTVLIVAIRGEMMERFRTMLKSFEEEMITNGEEIREQATDIEGDSIYSGLLN